MRNGHISTRTNALHAILPSFIDDGFGVWLLSEPEADIKFNEFFTKLNTWGRLRWTCTGFTDTLHFMDLTVSIDKNNKLDYKTLQK